MTFNEWADNNEVPILFRAWCKAGWDARDAQMRSDVAVVLEDMANAVPDADSAQAMREAARQLRGD